MAVKHLSFDRTTKTLTPAKARKRRIALTQRIRHVIQAVFVAFILTTSIIRWLSASGSTASIDALCPFGGLETLWQWLSTGQFVPKTHLSNLMLGLGLLLGTLLAGGTFCGWICPFGALQDALNWAMPFE